MSENINPIDKRREEGEQATHHLWPHEENFSIWISAFYGGNFISTNLDLRKVAILKVGDTNGSSCRYRVVSRNSDRALKLVGFDLWVGFKPRVVSTWNTKTKSSGIDVPAPLALLTGGTCTMTFTPVFGSTKTFESGIEIEPCSVDLSPEIEKFIVDSRVYWLRSNVPGGTIMSAGPDLQRTSMSECSPVPLQSKCGIALLGSSVGRVDLALGKDRENIW